MINGGFNYNWEISSAMFHVAPGRPEVPQG